MGRTNAAATYISRLAASRPVYRELIRRALEQLPPAEDGQESMRLICFDSMAKLARKLGVGRTTVRGDLERLRNYRWLQISADDGYLLGHREGRECFLLADVVAQEKLQENRVVSRLVLSDLLDTPEEPEVTGRRGPGRKWRPDA